MKGLLCLLVSFVCLWGCSNSASKFKTDNDGNISVVSTNGSSNIVDENLPILSPKPTEVNTGEQIIRGSFRVDTYEDSQLFSSLYFREGLFVKGIGYNTETKKKESETTYFYKKNGEFDYAEFNGKKASNEFNNEVARSFKESEFHYHLLKSKGIVIPLPDIAADEINDISDILSIADEYNDFEKTDQSNGSQRVIKFIGFNKTHRFPNSPMAFVIGNGDFITIKDYELILENSFPVKESVRTDQGELTRIYSYKNGKLISIDYEFTDLESRNNSLKKRFEYHELQ